MEIRFGGDLLPALKAIEDGDQALRLAHLGNALSVIKQSLPENSWVGIYRYDGSRLILDCFQGTPACETIRLGKGVVGGCYEKGEPIFVSDVSAFPGYICCDEAAQSEICCPIYQNEEIVAILDIDRPDHHDFSNEVNLYQEIAKILANWL